MSIEIRTPAEADRDGVADCLRVSLNFPGSWLKHRASLLALEQFVCAFDGGRVVATAAGRPFRQWFGGADLPMTGVWAVATLPEVRGSGLASRLVTEILRRGRERGETISTLYPATLRPYRRLGFELAGTYTDHRVALDRLPDANPELPVKEYVAHDDLAGVRACFDTHVRTHNGTIDCDDERWWTERILRHADPDVVERAVVVAGADGLEGYSSFHYEKGSGDLDVSFDIGATHLVATTPAALRSLLAYFRGFRGIGQTLLWSGPPVDPAAMLLGEQSLKPDYVYRWMTRLLDVPGALESRGYPPVDGSAVVAVDDALYPENSGPWLVAADRGKVTVVRTDAEPASPPVAIGTLSALFTGFISAVDAVRLGAIRPDDPAVELLRQLFSGPAPWMQDFF